MLRGETLPGYERLLRKKRQEYLIQSQPFQEMTPDTGIGKWLDDFWLWDAENEEEILLNDTQLHDLNIALQKRYMVLREAEALRMDKSTAADVLCGCAFCCTSLQFTALPFSVS